jgi:hypothetical protein
MRAVEVQLHQSEHRHYMEWPASRSLPLYHPSKKAQIPIANDAACTPEPVWLLHRKILCRFPGIETLLPGRADRSAVLSRLLERVGTLSHLQRAPQGQCPWCYITRDLELQFSITCANYHREAASHKPACVITVSFLFQPLALS